MAEAGAGGEQYRKLSRVPSMAFDRLRSFNLSRFATPAPEPAVAGAVDLGYEQSTAPAVEKEEPVVVQRMVKPEPKPELEPETEREHAATHVERSRSEAAAQEELLRLRKSASDRSAFAHLEADEVEETVRAVEARRPATTREGARRAPAAEPDPEEEAEEAGAGGEVDALADAFINRFHHQLKLQRIESFIRHRETVRRGQAAAGGV